MGSLGLRGSPFLQWERVAYSSGSSLTGWVDYSGATTGWSVDSGYLKTSTVSLPIKAEIAATCSHALATAYPLKPPVAPLMYFVCKARWPSGGTSGDSTDLIMSIGYQQTYYGTGFADASNSKGYVLRHTYGASGGTWSPNYGGLAEDTDIEVGMLMVGTHTVHAFVNGTCVASDQLDGYSAGGQVVPLQWRPLNNNQQDRDLTATFEINLDNSDDPGVNKQLRIRQLSLWRATFALPGF